MSDEHVVTETQVVADLLRRFEHPRAYAGDYEADFADRILRALGRHDEHDWYTMRNVARRFQKRWSLVEDPEWDWCWRQTVGGREVRERCMPGEVEVVHDVLDQMP